MHEFIYEKENSLSEKICDELLEIFNNNSTCDTNNFNIIENNINLNKILNDELHSSLKDYFLKIDPNDNVYFLNTNLKLNGFTICKILKNNELSIYNQRVIFEKSKYILLNFTWYLNNIDNNNKDNYDVNDGASIFINNYSVKPKKGKLVIFPCEWFINYREKSSKINDKYILNNFIYLNII